MSELSSAVRLIRQDSARWIEPQEIGDPDSLSVTDILQLMFHYPPLRALAWFRIGGWLKRIGVRGAAGYVQRRLLRVYGLELEVGADIGGGFYVAHPSGCTIRAARIGENATVVAAVTVGLTNELQWPVLGDRVFLGAGCRVLGPIVLGNDVRVGANAVVLTDVGDDVTVVGIPARPITRKAST